MNLVAKEFVSARDDARGVLVLSRFAGAAAQLTDARIINPCAIDDAARVLSEALNMSDLEQAYRMRRMRSTLEQSNAYWWGGRLLQDAAECGARIARATFGAHSRSRNGSPDVQDTDEESDLRQAEPAIAAADVDPLSSSPSRGLPGEPEPPAEQSIEPPLREQYLRQRDPPGFRAHAVAKLR